MRMSKDTRFFLALEAVLAILVVVFIGLLFSDRGKEDKIAVIVNNPGEGKWEAVIEGIKRCAKNNGVGVVICNTDSIKDGEELKVLIEDQLKSGATGLIVGSVSDSYGIDVLNSYATSIPVAMLEEDGESGQTLISRVGPDNYEIGRALAKTVIDDYAGNMDGKTVGVILRSNDLPCDAERAKGFEEVIKESGAVIAWKFEEETQKDGMSGIKHYISSHNKVNIIAAMDTTILESITDAAVAKKVHGALIYGVGNSMKTVYYLDHEAIEHLAVIDGYSMGYDACREVTEKLAGKSYEMQNRGVEYRILRQQDLFYAENAEFVFTHD